MKEITDSIYAEPEGLLAGVGSSAGPGRCFYDQQGLEHLIYTRRAFAEDTQQLEVVLTVLIKANREMRWAAARFARCPEEVC